MIVLPIFLSTPDLVNGTPVFMARAPLRYRSQELNKKQKIIYGIWIFELKLIFLHKTFRKMILSFSVSNFRSFKDRTTFLMEASATQAKSQNVAIIEIVKSKRRVLKTSLIYGANASGKTSLIRALHALCSEVRGVTKSVGGGTVPLYDPFTLDKESSNKPSTMEVEFIVNGMRYRYYIKFNDKMFLDERLDYYPKGSSKANLFCRNAPSDGNHSPKYVSGIPFKERPEFSVFSNKLILSKFLYDFPHPMIQPAASFLSKIGFANSYSPYMKSSLWEEGQVLLKDSFYRDRLKKILRFVDLGITDFTLSEQGDLPNTQLTHKSSSATNSTILMSEESLGTSMLFILGPKILQALNDGTPLFVDEFDTSFHSFISDFIIKMFTSEKINPKNAQLVIVTHDVTLMNEERIRRDQVWFAQKNDNGASELFSLSDFEGVRENTPFAKWYLASKFGAVPTIDRIEKLFNE